MASDTSSSDEALVTLERVLVAVDGSENSQRAAKTAVAIAEKFKAQLIVTHAIQVPFYSFAQSSSVVPTEAVTNYLATAREDAKVMLDKTVQLAKANSVKAESLVQENVQSVVEAIVNVAQSRKVDLIVIGTRGLHGFKKLLLGSVSSGVINHAHCPVLVVR